MTKNKKSKKSEETDFNSERLEVLSLAQDLENISLRIEAIQAKMQAANLEASAQIRDLQIRGASLHEKFQNSLKSLKDKINVPEGKELNLRTGEIVEKTEPQNKPSA